MAKITKTEVVVVTPAKYTLELDQFEAEVLAAILSKFGGSPTESHRKYAKRVADELTRVGVDWYETEAYESLNGDGGMFHNVESLSESL